MSDISATFPIRIDCTVKRDDLKPAAELVGNWVPPGRWSLNATSRLWGLCTLAGIILWGCTPLILKWLNPPPPSPEPVEVDDSGRLFLYLQLAFFAVIVIGSFWVTFFRGLRKIRVAMESETATFSEESVTWKTHETRIENKWIVFHGVSECPTLFVLHMSKQQFRIVPKRGMTPPQIAVLRNLFQSQIATRGTFPVVINR